MGLVYPDVIGLGHYKRAGKDSVAEVLVREHGYVRLAFADKLRQFVYETQPDVRLLVDIHGWEQAKTAYPNVRDALIDTGNAARRVLGADVWIIAVQHEMAYTDKRYVISDLRYPNEVAWVQELGRAWKIERPGVKPGNDVADQALIDYDGWDRTLVNDGSLVDLRTKVIECLTPSN